MIFVTGGTGFLGRHLIPHLCRAGYRLRVLTREPHKQTRLAHYPNVEIVQGDVRDGIPPALLADCEYIIHAAGLFSMWSDAGDFETTNVLGTRNLLAVAEQVGIKRFLYVSTVAVIGQPQQDIVLDEKHPPRPADPYQASKLKAEQLVRQAHLEGQLETVVIRPGAFYGPLGDYAFNRLFFTDPMRGIIMQMDGGHYIIFPAFIDDVAEGILLALEKGRSGEVYNICGDPLSHREAFDVICKEANLKFPRLNIPGFIGLRFAQFLTGLSHITRQEPFYSTGLRSYVFNDWRVNTDKAKRELGFVPTPFEEGARRTIAWYRAGKPTDLPELSC